MKKIKILLACFFSLVILAGCKSENIVNENSDARDSTDVAATVLTSQQENNTDIQTSVPPEMLQPFSTTSEQYSQSQTETTTSSVQEQQTSNETTAATSEEISESEIPPETVQSETTDLPPEETAESNPEGITKYTDQEHGQEFIILNVTPQKIYWDELDGFDVEQGQPIDIAIPAIFEDWVSDADEIMMYMSEKRKTFGDLLLNDGREIKGMTYPQYWSTDYLCPIKDGVVCFGEYTDNIRNTFSRVDDGVYIEEANFQYSEFPFENNMSVSSLDLYFETIKKDHDSLMQKMSENPDTNYDIAGFWGYQDGIRFRAAINYIY